MNSVKEEGKKDIQKAINDLKKEKATIGVYITSKSYPVQSIGMGYSGPAAYYTDPTSVHFGSTSKSMVCSKCGNLFYYNDNKLSAIFAAGVASPNVYCTHCGSPNIPN